VVDRFAKVHSLTRYIKGHTAKSIKYWLQAALAFADLPTVVEAKDYIRQHQQAIEDQRAAKVERAKDRAIDALKAQQKRRRVPLQGREQELLIWHASERMALHAAQKEETSKGGIFSRIKNAVLSLVRRTPGLRSILGHITGDAELGLAQRHELEERALYQRHESERAVIEREKRSMAVVEARELKALGMALCRKIIDSGGHAPSLFVQPRHEDESLHGIHERLLLHRRRKLVAIFNAKANPRTKHGADERKTAPRLTLDWNKRPRGT